MIIGELQVLKEVLIPSCGQTVAQAFQPVRAQAKACGYRKQLFDRNSVLVFSYLMSRPRSRVTGTPGPARARRVQGTEQNVNKI